MEIPRYKVNQKSERTVFWKLSDINEIIWIRQINGKIFHAHGLKESLLFTCLYHPKQSKDPMQSLSIFQCLLQKTDIDQWNRIESP